MFEAFDADGNGCREEADFVALADRWGRLPQVREGPDLAARVDGVLKGWRQHLSQTVDTDPDGRIGLDGLLGMVDLPPAIPEAVTATAGTIFDAVDVNADGRTSRGEHHRLIDTWHGRPVETGGVFDLLDPDADGCLSRPEFAVLRTQFWISDDPPDPAT
jgi:hypothetical protein